MSGPIEDPKHPARHSSTEVGPTDAAFMERAIALAIQNVLSGNGGPFGAVVVKDGRIIAEGTNLVTTNNDPTAHAEIVALRAACRELKDFQLTGCDVYSSCEPCPMCLAALYWARPRRILFAGTREDAALAGFDDSYIYDQIALDMAKRDVAMHHFMREHGQKAFHAWKQKSDKVEY